MEGKKKKKSEEFVWPMETRCAGGRGEVSFDTGEICIYRDCMHMQQWPQYKYHIVGKYLMTYRQM